jgi:hypothetical protein
VSDATVTGIAVTGIAVTGTIATGITVNDRELTHPIPPGSDPMPNLTCPAF